MRFLLALMLIIFAIPAYAQTSIWDATDRTPATATMRLPVDTSGSSSPGHLDIADIDIYVKSQPAHLTISTKTIDYTFVLDDDGDVIDYASGSPGNFTVPLNSSVAFPTGTLLFPRSYGGGALTIVATGGVTLTTGSSLVYTSSSGALLKTDTDAWDVIGAD